MILHDEQERALAALMSGRNVFLTGKAGSGKSTVIREYLQRTAAERRVAVVAPTGIAALQLNGSTIHRFFDIPPRFESLDELDERPLSEDKCETLAAIDTIVIDEISMVRGDVFAALCRRLEQVQAEPKQIIVVGDFRQLPPVIDDESLRLYLQQEYQGAFVFETEAWRQLDFEVISLKISHRQTGEENAPFLRILNYIRSATSFTGMLSPRHPVTQLNRLCQQHGGAPVDVVRLCVYREDVKAWNRMMMNALPEREVAYHAEISGDVPPEDQPVDVLLYLKVGMRIMLRVNLYGTGETPIASNGDLGTVVELTDNAVKVQFDRLPEAQTITRYTWPISDYQVEKSEDGRYRLELIELGYFRQIPLIPAYAITVHKAQGITLPAMMFVRGKGCFEHGQLYTALSRCSSIEGLYLDSPITMFDCKHNPTVSRFCEEVEFEPGIFMAILREEPLPSRGKDRVKMFLQTVLMRYRQYHPDRSPSPEELNEEERRDMLYLYRQAVAYEPEHRQETLPVFRKYRIN